MEGEPVIRTLVSNIAVPYEESQTAYSDWAASYEQDLLKFGYSSHRVTADYVSKSIPENVRSSVRILDVGAGTGLVAKELRPRGFVHLDALDPNGNMMELAKQQGLYENYFIEPIMGTPSSLPENTYDVITGSGIYATNGHVPSEAIVEMIRLVKPGGHIIIVTRHLLIQTELYKNLEPLMAQLEAAGKWQKVARDIFPKFYLSDDGIAYHYQKL